jgi:hypothetical protein
VSLHLYVTQGEFDAGAAIEALMDGLAVTRRAWWPRPLHVWLSGALARPFVFGPVAGLRGWREAHGAAAAAAPMACGLQGPCAAMLEADPSTQPVLGTAVELSLLNSIYIAVRARRLRVVSIRPAWARATESPGRAGSASDQMLCCREPEALTVMALRSGRWTFAATYTPAPSAEEEERLLNRLQASLGIDAGCVALAAIEANDKNVPPLVHWSGSQSELAA